MADRIRIALCDDHAVVRSGLRRILEAESDLEVVAEAGTADEAVAVARETQPDVFVMDVGLPDRSGHELMTELKSRYCLRGIALSGYGMEEDVQRSQEAGFERHLTKPVNLQLLKEAIREVAGAS